MMLLRGMIRVKPLHMCSHGYLTKNLNTNTPNEAAISGESKPQTVNDSNHQGRTQNLKLSNNENVSYYFCCMHQYLIEFYLPKRTKTIYFQGLSGW